MALAVAKVVDDAAPVQLAQRAQVSLTQVGHVDVIPDAGPVRGVIIGAEYRQRRAPLQRSVYHQRDQMGFGVMVLSQHACRVGAGGVEIAQASTPQAMQLVRPEQRTLDHQLALAVGGRRGDPGILSDGQAVGHAEQVGCAGQHEARNPVADAGVHQAHP